MGNIGPWQIIIVAVLVVLLFGRGKISELMGDVAKGINSFKRGLKEEEPAPEKVEATKTIEQSPQEAAPTPDESKSRVS